MSADLPAASLFLAKNIATGLSDVGLTAEANLSILLFILDELSARSFPKVATLPTAFTPPNINGKYITESAPNFTRFINFLTASFCESSGN